MTIRLTNAVQLGLDNSSSFDDYSVVIFPCSKDMVSKLCNGDIVTDVVKELGLGNIIGALIKQDDFKGEIGNTLIHNVLHSNGKQCLSVILVGTDSTEKDMHLDKASFDAGISAVPAIPNDVEKVLVFTDIFGSGCALNSEQLCSFGVGIGYGAYCFSHYITDSDRIAKVSKLKQVLLRSSSISKDSLEHSNNMLATSCITRDLVNYTPNELYPDSYASFIRDDLAGLPNLKIHIYDVTELERIGMDMLLAVGKGSDHPSRVVVIEYRGNHNTEDMEVSFVGKGVTFDSGGLSLKPSNSMVDMKTDMAGSAVVVGIMKLLSLNGIGINAVGAVGLVENSVGSSAQRPGDVVKSLSGKTVEILNTDAEGRLVLGDVMYYIQREYKPKRMIDLATLTGAIMVALGSCYAGLFSNSPELTNLLLKSGQETGEGVWHMPMGSKYAKMLKSNIADIQNISNTGLAGSITAAQFLAHFINEDEVQWAHLDIAGTAYMNKYDIASGKKGATGYGLRLLYKYVLSILGDSKPEQ